MSGSQEHDVDLVRVTYIKLAMWLKLNGHPLVQRTMLPEGQIVYLFRRTEALDELIRYWAEDPEAQRLSRFASLVSYEIRRTIKRRRALGLPASFFNSDADSALVRD
jgi:hypothetical protein